MNYYIAVLKKYAEFNGRARRAEFWNFVLFNFIISFVLGFIGGLIGFPYFSYAYGLAVLVPGIAVGIRRLHDIGKPGTWILIALIPLVGLYLIYLYTIDSVSGSNQWGANPKGT